MKAKYERVTIVDILLNVLRKAPNKGLTIDEIIFFCNDSQEEIRVVKSTIRSYLRVLVHEDIVFKSDDHYSLKVQLQSEDNSEIRRIIRWPRSKDRRKTLGRRKDDAHRKYFINTLQSIDSVADYIKSLVAQEETKPDTSVIESENGKVIIAKIQAELFIVECKILHK